MWVTVIVKFVEPLVSGINTVIAPNIGGDSIIRVHCLADDGISNFKEGYGCGRGILLIKLTGKSSTDPNRSRIVIFSTRNDTYDGFIYPNFPAIKGGTRRIRKHTRSKRRFSRKN
jgi:hypothetical protein